MPAPTALSAALSGDYRPNLFCLQALVSEFADVE